MASVNSCWPQPYAAGGHKVPYVMVQSELTSLTSEKAHFGVYLQLCAGTIEAACKDKFNPLSQRPDKTLFSRFGVSRPNTPICQKRFVRGHKVSKGLFAFAVLVP